MTEGDLSSIESALDICIPETYRNAALSGSSLPAAMFSDVRTIVGVNLSYRRSSWLSRPLERFFFVFGRDDAGNALYIDLDVPGEPVMSADHEHRRGRVEARSFSEWFSRGNANI